jgi:hypothetical protein
MVIMPINKISYKVIIASPSDVENERNIVSDVIDEVNTIFKNEPVSLQLFRWETDVSPSFHPKGPQALIDKELDISNSDILIGVFYMRFGKQSSNYESGTVHEINQAIESKNKTEIKLYFKKPVKINFENIDDETYEQYKKVKGFKEKIKTKSLICEFVEEEEFRLKLRKHLINFLNNKKDTYSVDKNSIKQYNYNTSRGNEIINVKDEEELLRAIGSDKTIVLEPKDYIISNVKKFKSDFIEWDKEFDGYQIVIKNLKNLRIFGDKNNKSRIIVEPQYADVLIFKNISYMNISNIIAGHAPKRGSCVGKVLSFYDSDNICLNNSILFGSGTEGLFLENVNYFDFKYSIIEECTQGIITILNSKNILFKESIFRNNELWGTLNVEFFSNVRLKNCIFKRNHCEFIDEKFDLFLRSLIDVSSDSNVIIDNSKFIENKVEFLANNDKYIEFNNIELLNNTFLSNDKPFRYKGINKKIIL